MQSFHFSVMVFFKFYFEVKHHSKVKGVEISTDSVCPL